ncbi:MAG: putative metallopeptidase [Synergistaceae bacterium]|nr:putative metallopeptidase [Synergistaceae bacterium]
MSEDFEDSAEFTYEICNTKIRPIAEALINKYRELAHIDVDKILFIVNHRSAGSKRRVTLAKTMRMPPKWTELLYQLGACSYFYIMEFYAKTTATMDESQMVALVYHELRRIGQEGEILSPDINEWYPMFVGLGRKWFYPDNTCPNLLDDSVDWKKLMGSYYEDIQSEGDNPM